MSQPLFPVISAPRPFLSKAGEDPPTPLNDVYILRNSGADAWGEGLPDVVADAGVRNRLRVSRSGALGFSKPGAGIWATSRSVVVM